MIFFNYYNNSLILLFCPFPVIRYLPLTNLTVLRFHIKSLKFRADGMTYDNTLVKFRVSPPGGRVRADD